MNFLDLYNHYVSIERVIEEDPNIFQGDKKSTIPKKENGSSCIVDFIDNRKPSIYLTLNLLGGHISYESVQKSTVKITEDGLFEGQYFVERYVNLSRKAFTAVVIKSFPFWKDADTFYMTHGDSKPFTKFRDLVIIRDETLPPVKILLIQKFSEYYGSKFGILSGKKAIRFPLCSFSRPAFNLLAKGEILALPESFKQEEVGIQNLIDRIIAEFPKSYI